MLLGGAFDPPSGAVIVLRGSHGTTQPAPAVHIAAQFHHGQKLRKGSLRRIERDEVEALVKEDPYVANGLVPLGDLQGQEGFGGLR